MEVINKYARDYYFSQEGTYLRMYGCSRAPSLLPRYVTDFIFHKEDVRKFFLNGVGSFLHEMKKATSPPLLFCIGGYKFFKVKGDDDFVKDLESFYFGKKSF